MSVVYAMDRLLLLLSLWCSGQLHPVGSARSETNGNNRRAGARGSMIKVLETVAEV